MHGTVNVYQMSEEERLAYIEKHPIRPTRKAKKRAESDFSYIPIDYKWRPEKARAARMSTK